MLYTLLIYHAEEGFEARSEADREAALSAHRELQKRAKSKDALVMADQLMPTSAATTVHHNGGRPAIMDGPFAETKEQLVGFYVLECTDLDEALDYAKMIPVAEPGSVEVRPVAYCGVKDEV